MRQHDTVAPERKFYLRSRRFGFSGPAWAIYEGEESEGEIAKQPIAYFMDEKLARAFVCGKQSVAPEQSQWLPIETAPINQKVIIGYYNRLGKWRSVMGRYYPENTLDGEAIDRDYAPEGWYEECESQETIMPTEEPPTRWTSLPRSPNANDFQQSQLSREEAERIAGIRASVERLSAGFADDDGELTETERTYEDTIRDLLGDLRFLLSQGDTQRAFPG